jgi:hypothetical protein
MLIPLDIPPGLSRVGTEYQSKGRYYAANLWRWFQGTHGPVGGWASLNDGVAGVCRAIHGWVDLTGASRAAIGTEQALYTLATNGTLTDITPDAYSTVSTASSWSLDNAGQQLFGVNDADGTVYTWLPGDTEAAGLTNAPTGTALIVTDERILMVLGADGDPRMLQWSDSEAFTSWTPSTTNLTRDFPVQTNGTLMDAAKIRGGLLLWSSEDLHLVRYIQRPLVYSVEQIGDECGLIARGAMVVVNDTAYWMGRDDFYIWAGGVSPMPCPVREDVFGVASAPTRGINRSLTGLVRAVHMAEFNEIWWMYPQGTATENSKVVVFNYAENHWNLHTLIRTVGMPRGAGFPYPLLLDETGEVWEHENGTTRSAAGTIYAKSGPLEIGNGENIFLGRWVYPDEGTAGNVSTYFHTRFMPNQTETTHGPYTSANPIPVRFAGRQVSIEHRLVSGEGKVGTFRVEGTAGGKR